MRTVQGVPLVKDKRGLLVGVMPTGATVLAAAARGIPRQIVLPGDLQGDPRTAKTPIDTQVVLLVEMDVIQAAQPRWFAKVPLGGPVPPLSRYVDKVQVLDQAPEMIYELPSSPVMP